MPKILRRPNRKAADAVGEPLANQDRGAIRLCRMSPAAK